MSAYADTSFLVSLYILDSNSARAAAHMKQAKLPVLLTSLGELELTNALALRLFRKEIVRSRINAAHALLRKDIEAGVLTPKPLSVAMFEKAKQIARKRTPQLGTRTLDILHVASALVLQADVFYTYDANQGKLARLEGFVTP